MSQNSSILQPLIAPIELDKMERKSQKLLAKERFVESLNIIYEMIKYKEALQGVESNQFITFVAVVAKQFNQIGMQCLNQEKFKISASLFKLLIKILQPYEHQRILGMLSLSLNNLSCCYKRLGKIKQAQKCLEKALIVQQSQDALSLNQLNDGISTYTQNTQQEEHNVLTELNLCAIYSQQNDHEKGKYYAEIAINKIRKDLDSFKEQYKHLSFDMKIKHKATLNEKVSLLAIANYNLGSQLEFLNQMSDCIQRYEEAVKLAEEYLDKNCQLANEFRASLKQARNKQIALQMKRDDRTFTNLNKSKVNSFFQQYQPPTQSFEIGPHSSTHQQTNSNNQIILNSTSSNQQIPSTSLNQQNSKRINSRPLSAQVPRNNSNQIYQNHRSNNNIQNSKEEQFDQSSLQNIYNPQQQENLDSYQIHNQKAGKKSRPTSSYIRNSANPPQISYQTTQNQQSQFKKFQKRGMNIQTSSNQNESCSIYEAANAIYNDSSIENNYQRGSRRLIKENNRENRFLTQLHSSYQQSPQNQSQKLFFNNNQNNYNNYDFISEEEEGQREIDKQHKSSLEGSSSKNFKVHPLMLDRNNQNGFRSVGKPQNDREPHHPARKIRPESAKVNMQSRIYTTQQISSIEGSKASHQHEVIDKSIEKIYASNQNQLKELRQLNQQHHKQKMEQYMPVRKPPTIQKKRSSQMRGTKQGSQSKLKQYKNYSSAIQNTSIQQTPSQISQNQNYPFHSNYISQEQTQNDNMQVGSNTRAGNELFAQIDKSYNQIKDLNSFNPSNKGSIIKKQQDDLNEAYNREHQKQEQILFHNNQVLPKFIHQGKIPRFPQTQYHKSQLDQQEEEIINIQIQKKKSIEMKNYHKHQNSNFSIKQDQQRRQENNSSNRHVEDSKLKSKSRSRSKSKNSRSPSQKQNQKYSTEKLQNESPYIFNKMGINQFVSFSANQVYPFAPTQNEKVLKKDKGKQKKKKIKMSKQYESMKIKEDFMKQEDNLINKQETNSRQQARVDNQMSRKEEGRGMSSYQIEKQKVYSSAPESFNEKRLKLYNYKKILAHSVILIQNKFRQFLAKNKLKQMQEQKNKDRVVLYKAGYNSNQFGYCNLSFILQEGRVVEVIVRQIKKRTKILQREYTFEELGFSINQAIFNQGNSFQEQVKQRIYKLFGKLSGDIYQDFFNLGKPMTKIEKLTLESHRQTYQKELSIIQEQTQEQDLQKQSQHQQQSSFVEKLDQFMNNEYSQRSIIIASEIKQRNSTKLREDDEEEQQQIKGIEKLIGNQSMLSEISPKDQMKQEENKEMHQNNEKKKENDEEEEFDVNRIIQIQSNVRRVLAKKQAKQMKEQKLLQQQQHKEVNKSNNQILNLIQTQNTQQIVQLIDNSQANMFQLQSDTSLQTQKINFNNQKEAQLSQEEKKNLNNESFKSSQTVQVSKQYKIVSEEENHQKEESSSSKSQMKNINLEEQNKIRTKSMGNENQQLIGMKTQVEKEIIISDSQSNVKTAKGNYQNNIKQENISESQRSSKINQIVQLHQPIHSSSSVNSQRSNTSNKISTRRIILKQSQVKLTEEISQIKDEKECQQDQDEIKKQLTQQVNLKSSSNNIQEELEEVKVLNQNENEEQNENIKNSNQNKVDLLVKASTTIQKSFRGMSERNKYKSFKSAKKQQPQQMLSQISTRNIIKVGQTYYNLKIKTISLQMSSWQHQKVEQQFEGLEIEYYNIEKKREFKLYYSLSNKKERFFFQNDPKLFISSLLKKKIKNDIDGSLVFLDEQLNIVSRNVLTQKQLDYEKEKQMKSISEEKESSITKAMKQDDEPSNFETNKKQEKEEFQSLINDKDMAKTALKIQSVFRGTKVRKEVKVKKVEKHIKSKEGEKIIDTVKEQKIEQKLKTEENQNQKEKEDKELEKSVLKIQSVFRGKKTRKQISQFQINDKTQEKQQKLEEKKQIGNNQEIQESKKDEEIKQNEEQLQFEENDLKQIVKIQSVFRGKKVRNEVKLNKKENDLELIYLYQAANISNQRESQIDTVNQKLEQISLFYLNKEQNQEIIVLKCQQCEESLSFILKDFLDQYQCKKERENKEEVFSFLREILPKITIVENNKLKLQQKLIVQQQNTQESVVLQTLNKEELNELLLTSSIGGEQLLNSSSIGEQSLVGQAMFQSPLSISKNLIILEKNLENIKFEKDQQKLATLNIIIFKDIIQNMFVRICVVSQEQQNACVERISVEKLQNIAEKQKFKNLEEQADCLMKELIIRIGLMNSGLEQNQYLNFKDIHRLLCAFSFRKTSQELQKLSEIEQKTIKIQNAFRSKSKQKKQVQEELLQQPNAEIEGESLLNSDNNSIIDINKCKLVNKKIEDSIPSQNQICVIDKWKGGKDLIFSKNKKNTIRAAIYSNNKPSDIKDTDINIDLLENQNIQQFCTQQLSKCFTLELSKDGKNQILILNSKAYQKLNELIVIQNKEYMKNQQLSRVSEEDLNPNFSQSPKIKSTLTKEKSLDSKTLGNESTSLQKALTIYKEGNEISGINCLLEVKINYQQDCIIFSSQIKQNEQKQQQAMSFIIEKAQLQGKTLKQINDEVKEYISRLEIDKSQKDDWKLVLREHSINDYSILSNDVVFKKGIDIQGRFFIVTVAIEEKHLVIDAYEEQIKKRLELRIKRDKNRNTTPNHKEISNLVSKLEIRRISVSENSNGNQTQNSSDEILVLKT